MFLQNLKTSYENLFLKNNLFLQAAVKIRLGVEMKDFSYRHVSVTPTSTVICALLSSGFVERNIQSSEARVVYR